MTDILTQFPTEAEILAPDHTVEEVDRHLDFLSTTLKYGHKSNRANCIRRIDHWLDIRVVLTRDVDVEANAN